MILEFNSLKELFIFNVKYYRYLNNLSQEKLAEKSDYSLSFIANLESTKVFQTISIGSLYHLSKVLNIHITDLLQDLPETKNTK